MYFFELINQLIRQSSSVGNRLSRVVLQIHQVAQPPLHIATTFEPILKFVIHEVLMGEHSDIFKQ